MSLPPLADVLAVKSDDATVLHRVERSIDTESARWVVRRPASSWLIAKQSLPPTGSSNKDDPRTFFTEGEDLFDERQAHELTRAAMSEPTSLSRHAGDFGFVHVAPDQEAVFVRSCGGRVPVYLHKTRSYLALATRLTDLITLAPDEVALDPLACAMWGLGTSMLPGSRTFFRDISVIPRGHLVTVTADERTRIDRYWDPRPRVLAKPTEERRHAHIERCRTLLIDNLRRELDAEGHNLLTLSGGVDSSSLAALAAGTLAYRVGTLSLLPREEPNLSGELAYIENLRRNYRFERVWDFQFGYHDRIEAVQSAPTVAFPVVHPALGLLPRILKEHPVSVLFGGEFADHVCGSPFTYPDWLRHTSLLQLIARPAEWPQGRRTLPRWVKHRLLGLVRRPYLPLAGELPECVQPAVREEYRQWRADRRRALARDDRSLPYLALEAEGDAFIAMNWEVASALGVRRAWPFFNREMLELAFDCHPSELVGPDTKRLLRAALDGLVPPMNLHRRARGHWRPSARALPPPSQAPGLEQVFDPARLAETEAALDFPVSWLFAAFLTSLAELTGSSRSQRVNRQGAAAKGLPRKEGFEVK